MSLVIGVGGRPGQPSPMSGIVGRLTSPARHGDASGFARQNFSATLTEVPPSPDCCARPVRRMFWKPFPRTSWLAAPQHGE